MENTKNHSKSLRNHNSSTKRTFKTVRATPRKPRSSTAQFSPIFSRYAVGRSLSRFTGAFHSGPVGEPDVVARNILARATPVAPHFVIYSDVYVSGTTRPQYVAEVKGYNVFALSFLLTEGASDKAYEWTTLTDSQRASVKSQYAAAGNKLIVSVFGSTDAPTSSGANAISTANTVAAWVKKYNLDGIDVDYEDFGPFDAGDGKAEAWVISFTKQLRTKLPQGQYPESRPGRPLGVVFVVPPSKYRCREHSTGNALTFHQIIDLDLPWEMFPFEVVWLSQTRHGFNLR